MKNKYENEIKELYDDPKYYIEEFKDYDDDIDFWNNIVDQLKPTSILEVGIGNGRLIKLLHNKVQKYYGVDFSKQLVEYCNKNFRYDNVKLYNIDFKEFKIKNNYDLIILPFNVINNFYSVDDIIQCFCTLRSITTNKKAKIIIDTINPTLDDVTDRQQFIKTSKIKYKNQYIDIYENKRFDRINSTCIYKKKYMVRNEIIKEEILPNRIFSFQEINLLINLFKFKIVNLYGDYNFEKFDINSRKQIYVLEEI